MHQTEVVVTGLGAITPLGADVESTWKALLAGESGIRGCCATLRMCMTPTFSASRKPVKRPRRPSGRRGR
ncbi:beta-ketoacyl synthase N-terminal-like domain-containing protein, partial [Streptomyces virginiae]|uniref:beta-ketoacyl synthase N-terminal-like domain-containing protein n=1 Tax=Streptomyces virginiae TaxID=1961 RepID=UPI00342DFFDB